MFVSEDNVKTVVKTLLKYEGRLSNGFGFYCGDDLGDVNEALEEISREILGNIKVPGHKTPLKDFWPGG